MTNAIYDQLFSTMVLPVKPAMQATGAQLQITDPGTVEMAAGVEGDFGGYAGYGMLDAAGIHADTSSESQQPAVQAEKK